MKGTDYPLVARRPVELAFQIVALQENSFNTKGTKCFTKGTKNFLENQEEGHAAKW
jgi:hypothetical protein